MFIFTSLVDFSVNTGGKIAHIGGALSGFLFAYYYKRGKDITKGFDRTMDSIATWFKPGKEKLKVTYKRSAGQKPPADDIQYKQEKAAEQKEIDQILDKISKAGYDSLSSREKEMLFKMSNKK
jgi:rhomboid family protein